MKAAEEEEEGGGDLRTGRPGKPVGVGLAVEVAVGVEEGLKYLPLEFLGAVEGTCLRTSLP